MVEAPEKIWADREFWPKVDVRGPDECWLWQGTNMGKGYGAIRPAGSDRPTGAHRVSWAMHNGRWPAHGEIVMHSCDTPACVNPGHLSIGSQQENVQDCVRKGRHKPFIPPKKKTCKNGHEFTDENTEYVRSRGYMVRRCVTCRRATNRKWIAQNGK